MILDIARLMLFPALMAFAAASDLFTMTISNRVSLALAAGFLVLALLSGMGLYDTLAHIGAGAAVLAVAFALPVRRPGLAAQAAREEQRNSLRHRAGDRRTDDLSGDGMDQGGRPRPLRHSLTGLSKLSLRRFRYASLTML